MMLTKRSKHLKRNEYSELVSKLNFSA